jgi:hypothetical protein
MTATLGSYVQCIKSVTSATLWIVYVAGAGVEGLWAQVQSAQDSSPLDGAMALSLDTNASRPGAVRAVEVGGWGNWESQQVCVNGDATTMKKNGSSTNKRTYDFIDLAPNMVPVLSPRFRAT